MSLNKADVLQFVAENDVKFIRLAFCDIFGVQKNIAIMATEIEKAFSHGIPFDASAVSGFMNVEDSDLLLFPDPDTLSILPWRPSQGRVVRLFCNIKYPDGRPFEGDGRTILANAVKRAGDMGFTLTIGTKCEFYLFERDETGHPTKVPHDYAGYLDITPRDKGENIRRQICLTLEEMGVKPENSHHEHGPGQNEIDFASGDPLTAADNFITFKSVVTTLANGSGLFASFMPKPLKDKSGSGLHINLSLLKNGINLLDGSEISGDCAHFIAGILERISDLTVFLNPLTNSYARFGEFEAPKYITWSHQNSSHLIKIPRIPGANAAFTIRSPDAMANPYFVFALLINAGLDGILKQTKLPTPCRVNLFTATAREAKHYKTLPENLNKAIKTCEKSEFIKSTLPQKIIAHFLNIKKKEWDAYNEAADKNALEDALYFC